jgi:hypothetical protein
LNDLVFQPLVISFRMVVKAELHYSSVQGDCPYQVHSFQAPFLDGALKSLRMRIEIGKTRLVASFSSARQTSPSAAGQQSSNTTPPSHQNLPAVLFQDIVPF